MEAFLKRPLLPYVCVVLLWIFSFLAHHQLTMLNYVAGVSLLYLPAGIRTVSVFVFGFKGALAVFVGSLLTIPFEFPDLKLTADEVLWTIGVAAASAFSAFIAMEAVRYWKKLPISLEGLTMRDVVYIVISQGFVSSTLHQMLFHFKDVADEYVNHTMEQAVVYWGAMATGDILGSMFVLLSVMIAYQFFAKQR